MIGRLAAVMIVAAVAAVVTPMCAITNLEATTMELYSGFANQSIKDVAKRAREYKLAGMNDSALVCYTVLENRYRPDISKEDARLIVDAYSDRARLYCFNYFDYPKAFESAFRARDIMKLHDVENSHVYLSLGMLYSTVSPTSTTVSADADSLMARNAIKELKRGFDLALRDDDRYTLNLTMSNLILQSYALGTVDNIKDESRKFLSLEPSGDSEDFDTRLIGVLYNAYAALCAGQPCKASDLASEGIALIPPENATYSHYRCAFWQLSSKAAESQGDYRRAISCLRKALSIAEKYNIQDARSEFLHQLSGLYAKAGDEAGHEEYRTRFLMLKDSLLSYREFAQIGEINLMEDIRKAQAEAEKSDMARRTAERNLVMIVFVVVLVSLFLLMLFRKNRQLLRTNKTLLSKNEEMVRAEKRELESRTGYQEEIARLKNELNKKKPEPAPDTESLQSGSVDNETGSPRKYYTSSLTDADKNEIMTRILSFMETRTDDICSSEFTVEKLAEQIDSKPRHVSQVINEKYESNFPTLLNKYRIREACRRLVDPVYANYTFEGLASGIGFKSKSTFFIQFKKIIGLTPLQYRKASSCE